MAVAKNKTRDYVPRAILDQAITTLSDRAHAAESSLRRLLDYIDPDLLAKHNYDWQQAVANLLDE